MSDIAIAAVTATLRSVLQKALNPEGGTVTTLPLDKAENAGQANRVNLFLYHTAPNAAWRNQPIPNKSKPGETAFPPLALNLYYLLTAYGDDPTEESDHRLIGKAMRVLHDHAVLKPDDIRDATGATQFLGAAKLDQQFEPVKLTPEPLTLEEISKLWTTFQAKFRLSVAYQASVVLLESKRPLKSPLPVLKRGEDDRGVDIVPTMPGVLEGIEYRDLRSRDPAFPAAQIDDIVTLLGRDLPGRQCEVVLRDPRRTASDADPNANLVARLKPEADSNESKIFVRLDVPLSDSGAGPLQLYLEKQPPVEHGQPASAKRPQRSNSLRFGLAPSLVDGGTMSFVTLLEGGRRQLVLSCRPGITRGDDGSWPEVSLVLSPVSGPGEIAPIPLNTASPNLSSTTPVFDVDSVPPNEYRVRIRIETVESLVMKRDGTKLDFDERQKVRL